MISLIVALALNASPARADEAATPAPRPKMIKIQKLKLRVRRGWAKALLAEMNKNDFMLRGLGTGDGASPVNVTLAIANSVPAVTLAYATQKLFRADLRDVKAHHAAVRSVKQRMNAGISGAQANMHLINKTDWKAPLRAELKALHNPGFGTFVREAGRDLRLIALGTLTAVLIYDGVRLWMQVTMPPDAFERRRAELQDFVDQADYTLLQNDAR
jgi:hypothetical protein